MSDHKHSFHNLEGILMCACGETPETAYVKQAQAIAVMREALEQIGGPDVWQELLYLEKIGEMDPYGGFEKSERARDALAKANEALG